SNVQASGITGTTATITWTTDEPADSQVEYGPTASYGSTTALDATRTTAHSQALTGLTTNTPYHYRVRSRDAAGNLATSADATFTPVADATPPVISGLQASGITAAGATVTWTTSENADSQVEYGPTTAYGSSTTLDPAV